MNLELKKYPTQSLLRSYQFIFAQWLGGQLSTDTELEIVPTVNIFGEILIVLRAEYISRKDCDLKEFLDMEKEAIENFGKMVTLSDKQIRIIWERMQLQADEVLKRTHLKPSC